MLVLTHKTGQPTERYFSTYESVHIHLSFLVIGAAALSPHNTSLLLKILAPSGFLMC